MATRKKTDPEIAEEEVIEEEFDLSKKVSVQSLAPWILSFRGVTEAKDFVIPANSSTLISRNEILNQVNAGNKLFTGTDDNGSHASIYINDARTRQELGFESENYPQRILSAEAMKSLMNIKNQADFESQFAGIVITRAEKFHALKLLEDLECNDYKKIRFVEEYVGAKLGV